MNSSICKAIAAFCLIAASNSAYSFSTFSDGAGGVLKWGASNTPGTPGGTVTWDFIPVGTSGSSYCGTACPGTSVSSINIENSPGTGYTLTPLTSLESTIAAAFSKWAAVANISFSKISTDSGLPINNPGATSPNIRIGVFAFSSGGGAVGYAPPPNGGTGAGDILFDANSFYAFQPGNEGDQFYPGGPSTAPNDLQSLIVHEIGHTLGLAHPDPSIAGPCPVMQVTPECLGKIDRQLKADDIAGIQYIYGAPVPLPPALWLFGSSLAGLGFMARRRHAASKSS